MISKTRWVWLMSLLMMTTAHADDWKCRTHQAQGTWFGVGQTEAKAKKSAMTFCIKNAHETNTCIVDWCQRI